MKKAKNMNAALRLTAAAALAALTAACASPAPPSDRFYRLNPVVDAQPFAAPAVSGVLEVDRPITDGVLSERPLSYRQADGSLARYRYDLWAEPPATLVQGALTAALRKFGAAATVTTPDLRVPPEWVLRGRLHRFEMIPDAAKVEISLDLALVSARDGSLRMMKNYRRELPAQPGPEAEAAALTQAAGLIIQDFLSDLAAVKQ